MLRRPVLSLLICCAACERGTVIDPVDEATPPVKAFTVVDPRDGVHLSLSWKNPTAADFRGVRVVRRAGEEPLSSTDAFAQVAYEGKQEAWVDEGFDGASDVKPLVVGTTYHYAAYAMFGESGYSKPARLIEKLNAFLPARTFTVTPTSAGPLNLAWTLPDPVGDVVSVTVRRARGASPGKQGALDEKVVHEGADEAFADTDVVSGTRYFYALATRDQGGETSPALLADASTTPGRATALQAVAQAAGTIRLSWANPPDETFAGTRVVRKPGAAPANPTDGLTICDAAVTTCDDLHPPMGPVLHYAAFAHDDAGHFALPATASTTALDPVRVDFVDRVTSDGGEWVQALAAASDGSFLAGGRGGYMATGAGNVSFGPANGGQTLTTGPTYGQAYLTKFRANGQPDWIRTITSTVAENASTSWVSAVAFAPDGNVFAAGVYANVGVFSGGGTSVTLQPLGPACAGSGCTDGFVAKYGPTGTLLWAVRYGVHGSYAREDPIAVLPQAGGGVILVTTYDPGTSSGQGTPEALVIGSGAAAVTLQAASQRDPLVVARFDPNGTLVWARLVTGTLAAVQGAAATQAANGAAVVAGTFRGTLVFTDGSRSETLAAGTDTHGFLARFEPDGSLAWATSHTGANSQRIPAISIGLTGDVLLGGGTWDLASFGTATIGVAEQYGAFVARYSSAGAFKAVTGFEADGSAAVMGVVETSRGLTIVGERSGALTFGSGADRLVVPSPEDSSVFLAGLATNGQPRWVRSTGVTAITDGLVLAPVRPGTFLLGGTFRGPLSLFDGGVSQQVVSSAGTATDSTLGLDGWVASITEVSP